jgi:hypothetical protein
LSSPGWARRSTGGSLACTQGMRVRFPPSPPTHRCGGKGRRPWRSHKPRNAGSIPASATMAGSSKGRTAVLQAAHGGSIPSPATRSAHWWAKANGAPRGCEPRSNGLTLVRPQPTGPVQASSNGRTSGRLPENRGSSPRAWTTSTKCCRQHGALVRRRRGFDSRRRLQPRPAS